MSEKAPVLVVANPKSGGGLAGELVPHLARDLGRLDRLGYRVVSLAAFDMFPQTAHLEAVACFERRGE